MTNYLGMPCPRFLAPVLGPRRTTAGCVFLPDVHTDLNESNTIVPKDKGIFPIVKWAGGKRLLAETIKTILRMDELGNHTYFEPFVGGAAMLLHFLPSHAVCTDTNGELINLYNAVRTNPHLVVKGLQNHFKRHTPRYFYEIRAWDRDPRFSNLPAEVRAARFLYLNKTCFNGLWRMNRQGFNNVPIGRYASLPDLAAIEENLFAFHSYVAHAHVEFSVGDYSTVAGRIQPGDIVYFDPPYDVEPETTGFVSYTGDGFSRDDQRSLRDICLRLIEKGARVGISNSDTEFIRSLYSDKTIFTIHDELRATRSVGSRASTRKSVVELLIVAEKNN